MAKYNTARLLGLLQKLRQRRNIHRNSPRFDLLRIAAAVDRR
jgi:hypothetical protein